MSDEKINICPNCGNICKEEDIFCLNCGSRLGNKLYCPNCGSEISKDDCFCELCGIALKAPQPKPQNVIIMPYPQANLNAYSEDMIKCPYCYKKIERYTNKCPYCGEWVSGVSHLGCGSYLVLLSIFFSVALFLFGQDVHILGGVSGALLSLFLCLYFIPALIAESRGHDSCFAIFLVNLLLGWTILGWFVALIIAFTGRRR